jgi:hypothetical protein
MPGNDEETVKGSDHPGSLRSGLRVGSCLYDTDAGRGRVTPVRSVSARLPLGLQKYDHAAEILLQPSMRGFLRRDVDPEGMQSRGADYAANPTTSSSFAGRKPGQRRRKASSSVSFGTAVRTSRKGCTVVLFQRICCHVRLLSSRSIFLMQVCAVKGGQ